MVARHIGHHHPAQAQVDFILRGMGVGVQVAFVPVQHRHGKLPYRPRLHGQFQGYRGAQAMVVPFLHGAQKLQHIRGHVLGVCIGFLAHAPVHGAPQHRHIIAGKGQQRLPNHRVHAVALVGIQKPAVVIQRQEHVRQHAHIVGDVRHKGQQRLGLPEGVAQAADQPQQSLLLLCQMRHGIQRRQRLLKLLRPPIHADMQFARPVGQQVPVELHGCPASCAAGAAQQAQHQRVAGHTLPQRLKVLPAGSHLLPALHGKDPQRPLLLQRRHCQRLKPGQLL